MSCGSSVGPAVPLRASSLYAFPWSFIRKRGCVSARAPVPFLSSCPEVFVKVTREGLVYRVRSVEVFLFVPLPGGEDFSPFSQGTGRVPWWRCGCLCSFSRASLRLPRERAISSSPLLLRPGATPPLLLFGRIVRCRLSMAAAACRATPGEASRAASSTTVSAILYSSSGILVPPCTLPSRATSWHAGFLTGLGTMWLCLPLRPAICHCQWHPRVCSWLLLDRSQTVLLRYTHVVCLRPRGP